ncbi:MAG: diguanylate cyclase, partial [Burkholderiaceae bacterium]
LRNAERRLKAERVRKTFRLAVEGANEAFYMIEPLRTSDGNIVDYLIEDCNERAAEMNGVPQVQMIRKRFSEIYDKETIDRLLSILNRAFAQGFLEDEFFIDENSRHQAGWFLRRAVRSGEGIALTIRDITIAKLHEETQAKLALTDTLTGLLNRRWLNEYLPGALARTRSMRQRLALLFIDLDNFKNINDTLGHAAGDELLVAAAICLKGAVRKIDYVVRLGGDEFTILIENLERDASAELVAEQVLRSFSESEIFKRWNALNVKCSIGIAVFPSHATDADRLLHCADEAMYAAKSAGKGCYRMFKPASDEADLT